MALTKMVSETIWSLTDARLLADFASNLRYHRKQSQRFFDYQIHVMQFIQLLHCDALLTLIADHTANLLEALDLYSRILGNVEQAECHARRYGGMTLCLILDK